MTNPDNWKGHHIWCNFAGSNFAGSRLASECSQCKVLYERYPDDLSGTELAAKYFPEPIERKVKVNKPKKYEQEALSAYVMLSRDALDFLDYAKEISMEGRDLLYKMLTTFNPNHDEDTIELNELGARLIQNLPRKASIEDEKIYQAIADNYSEHKVWVGCGECDCSFPCHEGEERCRRLPLKGE